MMTVKAGVFLVAWAFFGVSCCSAGEIKPTVTSVIRGTREVEHMLDVLHLLADVRASIDDDANECKPQFGSNDSDFVMDQIRTRTRDDIEIVNIIEYSDESSTVEVFFRTDRPEVARVVLRVLRRKQVCEAFNVQLIVTE